MKKLIVPICTTLIVFGAPWVHNLTHRNIIAAIPDIGEPGAHFAAVSLSLLSIPLGALIALHFE